MKAIGFLERFHSWRLPKRKVLGWVSLKENQSVRTFLRHSDGELAPQNWIKSERTSKR
jgi:hypothetical protein